MLKRLLLALGLTLTLTLPAFAPLAMAQSGPFFQIPYVRVPGAFKIKFPQVAGFSNLVSVGGNSNESDAFYWEKGDTGTTFAGPFELGSATGRADYATVSVAFGNDGTLYYVWSDFNARRIYVRVRPPGQDFGPTTIVTGASAFPSEPDVAVAQTPTGRIIFVFWREAQGQLRYRFSQTNGTTWSGTGTVDTATFPEFSAYGSNNGAIAVGYTRPGGSSGDLQAYVGYWNGSGFGRERISPDRAGNFGEPTVDQLPNGSYVAVYRGIDRDGNWGTYIAGRNTDGTWNNSAPFGRIDRGNIDATWIEVDPEGNWHLFWSGDPASGPQNVYYARRNAGQTTFTPVIASGGGGGVYNVDGALTVRDNVYAHAVYERFEGDDSRLAYSMVNSPGATPAADGIVIEQGEAYTNKNSVRVDFTNARNNPTQVRYRWGAAPTATDPTVAFANPVNIPVPAVANPEACTTLTLYTQLVSSAGAQTGASSDAIVIDKAAQATASIAAAQPGYDPEFTRSTGATVTVRAAGECAGLASATVSGGASQVTIPINGAAQGTGTVSLRSGDGEKTLTVVATDRLGNTEVLPLTLTLDTTAPVLSDPGDVAITPGDEFTGIASVALTDLGVTEANLYGVQVTTRYTPAGGGAAVTGTAQVVPATLSGDALNFSFSVAAGLPANTARAGSYQLTIRLVDKAGNLSAASTAGTITFSQSPTFPRLYLPYASK